MCIELRSLAYSLLMLSRRGDGGKAVCRGGGLERRPHCTNCCGYCLARKRNYYIKDT